MIINHLTYSAQPSSLPEEEPVQRARTHVCLYVLLAAKNSNGHKKIEAELKKQKNTHTPFLAQEMTEQAAHCNWLISSLLCERRAEGLNYRAALGQDVITHRHVHRASPGTHLSRPRREGGCVPTLLSECVDVCVRAPLSVLLCPHTDYRGHWVGGGAHIVVKSNSLT